MPRKGWASGTETTSADLRGKERNAIQITKALSQEQWEVKDQIKGALLENEQIIMWKWLFLRKRYTQSILVSCLRELLCLKHHDNRMEIIEDWQFAHQWHRFLFQDLMDLILYLPHQVAEVTRDTCDWDAAADNGREVDSTWRGGAAGAMGAVVRCAGRCPTLKAAFGPGQPGQQPA